MHSIDGANAEEDRKVLGTGEGNKQAERHAQPAFDQIQ